VPVTFEKALDMISANGKPQEGNSTQQP
jgi:hypothetical protein